MKCVHYTVFSEPDGPTSQGKCQKCGAVTTGVNSLPDMSYWKGSNPRPKGKPKGAVATRFRRPKYVGEVAGTHAKALSGAAAMGELTGGWVKPKGGAE